MALGVRESTTATSLSSGSYYFSQEPLLYYIEAYDTGTGNVVPDSSTLKHQFEIAVSLDGVSVGTYFLPYTPQFVAQPKCEIDFKEVCKEWFSELVNPASGNQFDMDTLLTKSLSFTMQVTQVNLTSKTSTTSSIVTVNPAATIIFGGQDLYDRPYTTINLNNDLDYRGYVIDDPVADENQNKKFLTEKPQGACRADNSSANIIISGSTDPVESSTWFPGFNTNEDWESLLSLEAPETQSAAWTFSDGNSRWEFADNATWGTGEQTQILGWYPGEGIKNALYAGDSGSITVSGQFLTAALGVAEITWNFVGIVDGDVPWEYDILDSNTYDVTITPTVTQMSFDFDVASTYQAIGFFASSPGVGPFSQTDVTYFETIDFQVLWRDAYWLKTSYVGNNYYTPITNRGNIAFFLGEKQGDITPGVDYCVQIVNNNFVPLSEQYCNTTCCDNLRKYDKADLVFLGKLGSYEGARLYMATGVKQTVNDPISNIAASTFSYVTRNLRQLGDYTTRSWTLISDFVSPAEAEWLQTIASSQDVYIHLPGDNNGSLAQYRPVIVTSLESEVHLYNRDLYQFTITVQDANYNKR